MPARALVARAALAAVVVALLAPVAVAAERRSWDRLPDDRVLYVAPGQALDVLVRRAYPDGPAQWDAIRRWIVQHNPHAFVDGDPASLRGDVRLKLPQPSRLAAGGEADTAAAAAGTGSSTSGLELRFGDRYVFVDPAQSLRELVPRLYPDARAHWDALVEAMIGHNSERLARAGAEPASGDATIERGTRLSIPRVVGMPSGPAADPEERSERAEPPPSAPIGRVVTARGEVYALGRHDRRRDLVAGDPVRRDDAIHTGPEGRARIRLNDGEQLFVRASTRLRVREWELPEVGPGTRVLALARGGVRAIGGVIGSRSDDEYRTITPQTTLGVRGTQYALRLCGPGDCRAGGETLEPGLYLGVNSGRVSLLNQSGETTVAAGGYRHVAGPAAQPRAADPAVADILYVEGETIARPGEAGSARDEEDDGGPPWWLAFGLLLLAL